jgi:transcriptional regulator with XRE-family HTH domain
MRGDGIQAPRIALGVSQEKLGAKANVTGSTVRRLEHGLKVRGSTLAAVPKALRRLEDEADGL